MIIGAIFFVWYFLIRKSSGKTIDVTSDFLIEAYRDLITTQGNLTYQGLPLHIYLARNTANYDTLKLAYNSTYGGDLTQELTNKLAGQKLAEYVAELWQRGQIITP